MSVEVLAPIGRARPARVLEDLLTPQFVGNTQPFDGAEPCDPVRPVGVLRFARRGPVAIDVLPDGPSDHEGILPPCCELAASRTTYGRLGKMPCMQIE